MHKKAALKLLRFTSIYGIGRALNKAFGRIRVKWARRIYLTPKTAYVSVIGCGQFAFSTIAYFVAKEHGKVFLTAYDSDTTQAEGLVNYYRFKQQADKPREVFIQSGMTHLFIASNHATHTDYAIAAMENGVTNIHVEKPLATTSDDFNRLLAAITKFRPNIVVGYNRPFSAAIRQLKEEFVRLDTSQLSPFTLSCSISGHLIDEDHWYRNPEEGTRVCGNMGHWIDLSIHMFYWRRKLEWIDVTIAYANTDEPDDNIMVALTTNGHDLATINLTSRTEPFEGINETINVQFGDVIAKIDDFRSMVVWKGARVKRHRYFPKDVGHRLAVNQLWESNEENKRSWEEVVVSTFLMLFITDMVRDNERYARFKLPAQL